MADNKTSSSTTYGASGIAKANIERGMSGVSTANGGGQKTPPPPPPSNSGSKDGK